MANQKCIEQTALFYSSWETRHVQEAVDTLGDRQDPWLSRQLAEWQEGLQLHGWDPQKAGDFTSDMRMLIKRGKIRGPWWRLD